MSAQLVPLIAAGAVLFLASGKKKKKSGSSSSGQRGITYKKPPTTKIPQLYGPTASTPPKTNNSSADWMKRQEALTALSEFKFEYQGREIYVCPKCDPKGIDGKPGKNTKNAVKAFQAIAGITPSGNWGQTEDLAMFKIFKALGEGRLIPCDPLLSYPSPLGCFSQEDGSFGLMPSFESSPAPSPSPKPSPSPTPSPEPSPEPSPGPSSEYGPDELLVADGDCNYILHQDDRFFREQRALMIESALEGLTDGQAADEIHEEMMRRYIPMCLFLGKDNVGQGVRTWWSTNLAHVASGLQAYELLPDTLEEDAIEYGIL